MSVVIRVHPCSPVVNYLNAGRLLSASLAAGKGNTGRRETISLQLLPGSYRPEARAFLVGERGLQAVTIWVTLVGMAIRDFRHKGLERYFATGSLAGIQRKHANRLRLILEGRRTRELRRLPLRGTYEDA